MRLSRLDLTLERQMKLPVGPYDWSKVFHDWGLGKAPIEMGWVMALDVGSCVYTIVQVARGTRMKLPVHLPTLLAAVLVSGVDRFVFIHSHPGGIATASPLDLELTRLVSDAAAICGLYLVDHFIITDRPSSFLSLKMAGLYVPPTYLETDAWRTPVRVGMG